MDLKHLPRIGVESRLGLNIAIMLIVFCFASNSVITRFMVTNGLATAFALTVIRFVSGFFMLVALRLTLPKVFLQTRIKKTNIIGGILLASYGFSISFGYLFIGAAAGTLVFYASVVLTMSIYSIVIDREKLLPREVVGLIVAVVGIFILTYGRVATVTVMGVILMILTGVSWGCYSVFGRRFSDSFSYTFHSFAIVSVLAFPAQILLNPTEILKIPVSLEGIGLALYFGMISTALSYVLWHKALKRIKASQGGVYQMLVPVIAGTMGILLLSEQPTLALFTGGGLILLGIYLNR